MLNMNESTHQQQQQTTAAQQQQQQQQKQLFCSTTVAQQFLDQLTPDFVIIEEYIERLQLCLRNDDGDGNSMCYDYNNEVVEDNFIQDYDNLNNMIVNAYVEKCQFCDQYYCTTDEFASYVPIFLHKEDCTASAQFVSKEEQQHNIYSMPPTLLSSNIADNICYFCLDHLIKVKIPPVIKSFQVKMEDSIIALVMTVL